MESNKKMLREDIAEKLFIISAEISMFMLFLKRSGNETNSDFRFEMQKRIIRFEKIKQQYSAYLDLKYWNDPQTVRDIRRQIEEGLADTVEEAIKILNL